MLVFRLDLYNGNATYRPDFNERTNLVTAFPDRVVTTFLILTTPFYKRDSF